jgi:periplasmic protein CpxP/Spy
VPWFIQQGDCIIAPETKEKESKALTRPRPTEIMSRAQEMERWFDRMVEEFWRRPFPTLLRPERWWPAETGRMWKGELHPLFQLSLPLKKEDSMKTNILIISMTSTIALMGLGVQPSLADPDYGYSHAYSSEHGCCEQMRGHYGHSADHLRHLLQHQKEIGLTDEQVKKLKAIELDFDRARIKSEAEIQIAEREVLALVEEEKTDLSAIEVKVKQSELLEVGLRMLAFKARHDALAVLTPEQREKGKAGHEKRIHEMMGGRHGGPPSGGY